MKRILISYIILVFVSSCSTIAPAPTAALLPTITNTPLPTVTPTLVPTQTSIPTEPPIPFDQMTPEQKLALAPEIDGLTNEFYKNNQIIRRDDTGKVIEIYKVDTKETIQIPKGYTFFDINQFPNYDAFQKYSLDVCAPSLSKLGDDKEALLLEKALGLPEKFLWQNEVIGHAFLFTDKNWKCSRIIYSPEPELTGNPKNTPWGNWQGVVRIADLTSLEGDADVFIYYP